MSTFCFPENCKIVQIVAPAVGAGAVVTSDYVSLKNAIKAWIVVDYNEGHAATVVFQPLKATAVLPSNSTAITTAVRIWSNLATATNDTLVERTAATSYTSDNGVAAKQIIFEIDPAALGELAGTGPYDVIAFSATTPAAGDYIAANLVIEPRYANRASTSPSAVID